MKTKLILLYKLLNLIKLFLNFFDYSILDIDEEKNTNTNSFFNKKNLLKIIIYGTLPLRQLCYIFITYKITENMSNPDLQTALSIIAVLEIIDKSIVDVINEQIEEEIENKVDNISEKEIENKVDNISEKEIENKVDNISEKEIENKVDNISEKEIEN